MKVTCVEARRVDTGESVIADALRQWLTQKGGDPIGEVRLPKGSRCYDAPLLLLLFSKRNKGETRQNAGFENSNYGSRFQRVRKLLDEGVNTEAGNKHGIVALGFELWIVGNGFNAGLYVLIIVDAGWRWLRGRVCADGYGLDRVSLVGYGRWVGGITGRRVAIELAADSMVFVMAREELGLRRRMLMLEVSRGGGIVAVVVAGNYNGK